VTSEKTESGFGRIGAVLGRLRRDKRGATAIEFGMVATPFLMLVFGIIQVGLLFFATFTIENATEQAARLIRTGQSQGMTAASFAKCVCSFSASFVDCTNKLRINVQSFPTFAGITPPSGLTAAQTLNNTQNFTAGNGGDVVLVTTFYEWDLAGKLPFLKMTNMAGNNFLIQAATTFRNEPYTTTTAPPAKCL